MATPTLPLEQDLSGHLTGAVLMGANIPAHDETFDSAEAVAKVLAFFHQHVVDSRDAEQADDALVEFARAISTAVTAVTHREV
jgi:hypothetical protein